MKDYADLEKRLRGLSESDAAKATLVVRFNQPTGLPDWTPFKTPSVSLADVLTEAATALSALSKEVEMTRAGEFLFSKRKALVERCAMIAEGANYADVGEEYERGWDEAREKIAALIRSTGLSPATHGQEETKETR